MSENYSERSHIVTSATTWVARHPRVFVVCIALLLGIGTQGTVGAETFVEPYNAHSTSTGP
ncbi:hypothetical protein [Haloprofundus sp. MHR1]|uniref:hypothetical protein n=1 Tax=Haloprofundus sp. MHR1 TaxID=2572921 RepID=UPI0010BF4A2C|nr:hypothetical protein [Haloprofundus sp. MHR1]QCJ46606.1 hypothetical protein FCF25_05500 [Haloprofundus sp. MHR1]